MTDSIEYPEKIKGWVEFNDHSRIEIEATSSGLNPRYLNYMEYKIAVPEEPLFKFGIKKLHLDMMPAKSFTTICLGEVVDEGPEGFEENVSDSASGEEKARSAE